MGSLLVPNPLRCGEALFSGLQVFFLTGSSTFFFLIMSNILGSWNKKFLSFGGRIVLIKHVLAFIPIHLLAMVQFPY